MLAIDECVLVLLAAGRSTRFGGDRSKLGQDVLGQPLGLHAAIALEGLPFRERVAVIGAVDPGYRDRGFTVIRNPDPGRGMASSVGLGVERAIAGEASSVLIVLADMPRITAAHVRRLFDASTDAQSVVASSDGSRPSPPALFGAGRFADLSTLEGDAGARALIRGGRHVVTAPAELVDIDTVGELEDLRRRIGDPRLPSA